jgi:transposase
VIEGIAFRYRVGCPWRDVPEEFGPHQTLWRRHDRWSADGTWDRIMVVLIEQADAAGAVEWTVSVDSTISSADQHAATLPRTEVRPAHREVVVAGGRSLKRPIELQGSAR